MRTQCQRRYILEAIVWKCRVPKKGDPRRFHTILWLCIWALAHQPFTHCLRVMSAMNPRPHEDTNFILNLHMIAAQLETEWGRGGKLSGVVDPRDPTLVISPAGPPHPGLLSHPALACTGDRPLTPDYM